VVVSDTVGFIRELPHQLVAAFRATLEETIHADLLLHVVTRLAPCASIRSIR
jgi:GTPases